MSLSSEINNYFVNYGDYFDLKVINYTKQVVHNIKSSPTLQNFLQENKISASVLLNEMTPYSQYKLKNEGDETLNMKEIQSILNIVLFSYELEKLIMSDHVRFSSIGKAGEMYYIADKEAVDYFTMKYDIDMIEDVEFDFTILEGSVGNDLDMGVGNFGIN